MLNAKIYDIESLNCINSVYHAAASAFSTDYEMMLLDAYGLHFIPETLDPNECLELRWTEDYTCKNHLLRAFHGINTDTYPFDLTTLDKLSSPLGTEGILALRADTYDCSWLPFYRRYHADHMIVVFGVSVDGIQCRDKARPNGFSLGRNEVVAKDICVFRRGIPQNVSIQLFCDTLSAKAAQMAECGLSLDLSQLSSYLIDNLAPAELCRNGMTLEQSKLLVILKNIAFDRINLSTAFGYIQKQAGIILEEESNLLAELSQLYMKVELSLIKCVYANLPINKVKMRNLFTQITLHENEIIQKMERFI